MGDKPKAGATPPPAAKTKSEKTVKTEAKPAPKEEKENPPKKEEKQENEKKVEGKPPAPSQGPGPSSAPGPGQGPRPSSKMMTAEEVRKKGTFTFGEMVDLALASPEVGAVNFNILRMLLKDMCEKAGLTKTPVKLNDLETHQAQNFKDYIQGNLISSPMPGVLRIGHQGPAPHPSHRQQQQQPQQRSQGQQQGPPPPPAPGQKQARIQPPPDDADSATQTQGKSQQQTDPPQQKQPKQRQQRQKTGNEEDEEDHQGPAIQIQQVDEEQDTADEGTAGTGGGGGGKAPVQRAPRQVRSARPQEFVLPQEFQERMDYMEKQLEALYQLPGNSDLIEKAKAEGTSVSDMWQIIQLNNRIAAAEAAIQKMASLIEDIARNMGKLGSQARMMKKESEKLETATSDNQLKGQDCAEECTRLGESLKNLEKELNSIKTAWRNDRESLQQMLGVDLGRVPSFMKPTKVKRSPKEGENFERGTQTRKDKHTQSQSPKQYVKKAVEDYIPPEEFVKMTPEEIKKNITPDEIKQMTPAVYKELSPEQKKAVASVRKSIRSVSPPPQPGSRQHRQAPKEPIGVAQMSVEELADLPPKVIAEKMPYEEAVQLPPEVLEKMTDEQKEKVQKVIKRGPAKKDKETAPPPTTKKSLGVALMTDGEIQDLPAEEIVKKMSANEAKTLPDFVLDKLNDEQKAAVKKVKEEQTQDDDNSPVSTAAQTPRKKKEKKKPPMGLSMMTKDQLKKVTAEEIAEQMPYEEAKDIPSAVLEKLSRDKQEAIKNIVEKGPPKGYKEKPLEKRKTHVGLASMSATEIHEVSKSQLADMPYAEAKNIPNDVLEQMTDEQKETVHGILEAGPPPPISPEDDYSEFSDGDGVFEFEFEEESYGEAKSRKSEETQTQTSKGKRRSSVSGKSGGGGSLPELTTRDIENIAGIPADELAKALTPELAAAIPTDDIQAKFNKEQQKEIERLRRKLKKRRDEKERKKITAEMASQMSPEELAATLTEDNVDGLTESDIQSLPPAQAKVISDFKKSIGYIQYSDDSDLPHDQEVETVQVPTMGVETRRQSKSQSKAPKKKKVHKQKTSKADIQDEFRHPHLDLMRGPFPPSGGKQLPPVSLEEYLATLTPEQAADLAADVVQRELEKQYKHLQQMQRQLAIDIQDKMEFIYQKLLKELAVQGASSQYMAIGEPEHLGPGVCTGHGMPAGIAVCKFPEVADKRPESAAIPDGQLCPGPGVCPASATCPHCGGRSATPAAQEGYASKATGDDGRERGRRERRETMESEPRQSRRSKSPRHSEENESLLRDMKSLILLDVEKIREEVRAKNMEYNEVDIMEKVGALWEALKILKHNEEAMAVKIARQDALIKKLPLKLQKLTDENIEAIISGKAIKPQIRLEDGRGMMTPVNAAYSELPESLRRPQPGGAASTTIASEDIQTLFNNLANVIAECAELKDRLEQISTTARILETDTVTKQMLVEALSDKVDKAMLSTKVSYDEFGNTVDEVHNQLHNLMVEGYQRNENWKKVTSEMAAELVEKVDKVELNPLRSFFKSHLRNLEEKVRNLSQLIEEPDPAGTRKKLLKDYNCISCDRVVNISGVTNGPTLPTIGPIPAGHPTASKRALELHRMRMLRKYDPAKKNINALEKQGRQNEKTRKFLFTAKKDQDNDLIHSVNRYQGGSHTGITNADLISSNHHRGPGKVTPTPMQSARGDGNET